METRSHTSPVLGIDVGKRSRFARLTVFCQRLLSNNRI